MQRQILGSIHFILLSAQLYQLHKSSMSVQM